MTPLIDFVTAMTVGLSLQTVVDMPKSMAESPRVFCSMVQPIADSFATSKTSDYTPVQVDAKDASLTCTESGGAGVRLKSEEEMHLLYWGYGGFMTELPIR